MSILIIPAPSPAVTEPQITSSAFWPVIVPAEIRDQQRIDNTTPPARLKVTLIEAIATTNAALAEFRLAQQALGITALADIVADQIDGISINVHRYQRAVGCLAKALLLERLRDFDATGKGDKKADAQTDPIDDYRRDHLHAVSDIIGRSRSTIELI